MKLQTVKQNGPVFGLCCLYANFYGR